MKKKGDYKWSIMLSLILGLMVLSLSLYFIFNELWTGDDEDRQICRQSIQLRSALPDSGLGLDFLDFKSDYPLKCKTHVVEIDEKDLVEDKNGRMEAAERKIAEAMVECWALYDNGDSVAFPSKFFGSTVCVPCARIHLTNEAKDELGSKTIDIRSALDWPMGKDFSYYMYLKKKGKKFSAFDLASSSEFKFSGENAFVLRDNIWSKGESDEFISRLGGSSEALLFNGPGASLIGPSEVALPTLFYPYKGDLLINYGVMSVSKGDVGYVPYLFYFQVGQDPEPFGHLASEKLWRSFGMCDTWEGIPG